MAFRTDSLQDTMSSEPKGGVPLMRAVVLDLWQIPAIPVFNDLFFIPESYIFQEDLSVPN